jgi:hypothetical protein
MYPSKRIAYAYYGIMVFTLRYTWLHGGYRDGARNDYIWTSYLVCVVGKKAARHVPLHLRLALDR